jgi:hypothetical protein
MPRAEAKPGSAPQKLGVVVVVGSAAPHWIMRSVDCCTAMSEEDAMASEVRRPPGAPEICVEVPDAPFVLPAAMD